IQATDAGRTFRNAGRLLASSSSVHVVALGDRRLLPATEAEPIIRIRFMLAYAMFINKNQLDCRGGVITPYRLPTNGSAALCSLLSGLFGVSRGRFGGRGNLLFLKSLLALSRNHEPRW